MATSENGLDGTRASWWRRWWPVIVGPIIAISVAAPMALAGWVAFGIAGAKPNPIWGTLLWLGSAAILGAGVAVPTGPARATRVVIGLACAVVWFVVGRFVYGP